MRVNIRLKLIFSFLFVVIFTGVSTLIVGYTIIIDNIYGLARNSVQSHLNTTEYIYNDKINVFHLFMNHLASLQYIKEAMVTNNRQIILKKLREMQAELSLDIINITDARGTVLVRASNPLLYGDSVSHDPFVQRVISTQKSCQGSDIVEREYLEREGADLAKRAFIKLVRTPMARSGMKLSEERGLVLKAASPIFYQDRLVGIIYGAQLLNNNFEIVDRIQRLVFRGEKIDGRDAGNATIFLDDVRVSTNVRKNDNTRATGTQVSREVYRQVVEHGKVFDDRAFVVNNWYITAYGPIRDIENKVIGILYVGILEEKFDKIKRKTSIYFLSVIFVFSLFAISLSIYLIQGIIQPYNALVNSAKAVASGDYGVKVKITSQDEVAYLGNIFNRMIDAIVERDNKLKEQTQKQINQLEKLSSLGRLASGIAHEINNPLTGILTYSSLLLEDFEGTDFQEDLQVIVNETMRCRSIVKGILDFARETKLEKELTNVNTLIVDTMSILEKHVNFQNISIKKELSPDVPDMNIDINQFKSVINNLSLNAADAMPDGGTLTVRTHYDQVKRKVIVESEDTGIGIPEENLGKIYDPFFTTKERGKGTGLGMSVTYGIIKRHNGTIDVRSTVGVGTTFTIELPVQ